jgi:hypothetical protein
MKNKERIRGGKKKEKRKEGKSDRKMERKRNRDGKKKDGKIFDFKQRGLQCVPVNGRRTTSTETPTLVWTQ